MSTAPTVVFTVALTGLCFKISTVSVPSTIITRIVSLSLFLCQTYVVAVNKPGWSTQVNSVHRNRAYFNLAGITNCKCCVFFTHGEELPRRWHILACVWLWQFSYCLCRCAREPSCGAAGHYLSYSIYALFKIGRITNPQHNNPSCISLATWYKHWKVLTLLRQGSNYKNCY